MKQFYIFTFLLCVWITQRAHAQQTIFSDDFESGYTNEADLAGVNGWQVFANATAIVKSVNNNGAGFNGSDWYADIRNDGHQVIQQVLALIAGETYEFKAQAKKTGAWASLKIGAYDLSGTNPVLIIESASSVGVGYAEKTISFTAGYSGNHAFRFTKGDGATATAQVQIDNVEITCTTCTPASVDDFNKLKFTISPNPAQDIVRVTSNDILEKMELYSLTGAKILEVKGNNYINMNGISSGIYLLKVHSDNGSVATKKLIKN